MAWPDLKLRNLRHSRRDLLLKSVMLNLAGRTDSLRSILDSLLLEYYLLEIEKEQFLLAYCLIN